MKKSSVIILCLVLSFLAGAGGYAIAKSQPRPLELVKVDGDEMPGLTDRAKPDTCIAYLDENDIVHLQYVK